MIQVGPDHNSVGRRHDIASNSLVSITSYLVIETSKKDCFSKLPTLQSSPLGTCSFTLS